MGADEAGDPSEGSPIPPYVDAGYLLGDVTVSVANEGGPLDLRSDLDASPCNLGSVSNFATNQTLDIFGQPTYFADGGALPPGHYRITYLDGCMKYSYWEDWSVNAYQGPPDSWWLVGATTAQRLLVPPGTVGFLVGEGGFATFDECVQANLALSPIDFDFDGGPIALWLLDDPYTDNVAGDQGRNPKWRLDLLGGCSGLQ